MRTKYKYRKKNKKNFDINKSSVLIHYQETSGKHNFKITIVSRLDNDKINLLLAGMTNLSIPYYDNPLVAENLKR